MTVTEETKVRVLFAIALACAGLIPIAIAGSSSFRCPPALWWPAPTLARARANPGILHFPAIAADLCHIFQTIRNNSLFTHRLLDCDPGGRLF